MSDRQRFRVGRIVRYNPTAAEATANGAGPWAAQILAVNADDTVDLAVAAPTLTALAATLSATAIVTADADAAYGQPEADLINELKGAMDEVLPLLSQVKTSLGESRKASVPQGEGGGTFSFLAGSDI